MTNEKDERINVGAGMVLTYHATESVEEARAVVESCQFATTELRRLLKEHGVEWTKPKRIWWELIDCEPDDSVTIVEGVTIEEATDGTLVVYPLTPEQAIAATLGRGTCKLERASWDNGMCTWGCICSACDAHLEHETGIGYNFCPICGAKVVSE